MWRATSLMGLTLVRAPEGMMPIGEALAGLLISSTRR
jgi:hypothetical protein